MTNVNRLMLVAACVTLSSCERGCASMEKRNQTSKRQYEVTVFSGGDTVFHDNVRTMVNSEESSDGIYYFKDDTLVEISGDYILKSTK